MKYLPSQPIPADQDGQSTKLDDESPSTKNSNDGQRNNKRHNDSQRDGKDGRRCFLEPIVEIHTPIQRQESAVKFAHYNNLNFGPIQQNIVDNEFQVGALVVESILGKGSFASVLLARQSCCHYALKRIEKKRNLPKRDLDNLAREIKAAQMIHHPNVVECHKVIHTPYNIYLVMELGYRDLFDYFGKDVGGPVPIQVLREITLGLIKGVAHLHSIGIAHLDIKPENVLVSRNVKPWELTSEDIRLCDFGLCEIAQKDDLTGPIEVRGCRGTPGFACPEMIVNRGCEGRQADMWAVGVTLLDMACRVPRGWMELQQSRNFEQRLWGMMETIQCRDHFVDANVHNFVNNLLRWNPEDRLTAKQALHHSWFYGGSSYIC